MEKVTSFVNSRGRAIREIFPRTRDLTRELTYKLRTRACLVPRRPENRTLASVVGSAAEFAVGWHFGSSPEQMVDRVAQCGRDGQKLAALLRACLDELR